jgi:LPPG:FO 2-phospho-L-lactate transferase
MAMKVTALAGGVGGAKLADGLAACLDPDSLTVIVNTADDFEHLGLWISPDLDTVTYTLAGLADPNRGWGRVDETWHFMDVLQTLGGPTWFRLGDHDLALHHYRTMRREQGESLSRITEEIRTQFGIETAILPMCDEPVQTMVMTKDGELSFQVYFVAEQCEPHVEGFRFNGIEKARVTAAVRDSIEAADLVVFCPSNPWVSLDPIIAVGEMRALVAQKPTYMVSPIVAGKTIKGPAAKMYSELGIPASALAVADHYADLLEGMLIDRQDAQLAAQIEALGIQVRLEQTIMHTSEDRVRVAQSVLDFGQVVNKKEKDQ